MVIMMVITMTANRLKHYIRWLSRIFITSQKAKVKEGGLMIVINPHFLSDDDDDDDDEVGP
jgi:hypothetical protein